MLSSKDGVFDRARGRLAGSDRYLTKPFTKEGLVEAVVPARETIQRLFLERPAMPIKNILIVDDSPTDRQFLSDLLSKNGFKVSTAENADDALAKAKQLKPDLVLMDVVMPGQSGFQATRALSKDEATKAIPVIICTSKSQETDKQWGMKQGARDYVVKPVKGPELLAKIAALG